jgi:predicted enzyme related to lactoylglutathione lyase
MNKPMLGLRTAIYQVSDIEAAKKWYEKAFETAPYFDEPFYVGFDIGGFELGLQPEETPSLDKTESVVAYWGVEDVEKEYNRLLTLGATAFETPREVGGGIIVAKVKDFWGNIIGLIYNPHFDKTKVI